MKKIIIGAVLSLTLVLSLVILPKPASASIFSDFVEWLVPGQTNTTSNVGSLQTRIGLNTPDSRTEAISSGSVTSDVVLGEFDMKIQNLPATINTLNFSIKVATPNTLPNDYINLPTAVNALGNGDSSISVQSIFRNIRLYSGSTELPGALTISATNPAIVTFSNMSIPLNVDQWKSVTLKADVLPNTIPSISRSTLLAATVVGVDSNSQLIDVKNAANRTANNLILAPNAGVALTKHGFSKRSPSQFDRSGRWLSSYPTYTFTINNSSNNPIYISKTASIALATTTSAGSNASTTVSGNMINASGSTTGDTATSYVINNSRTFTVDFTIDNTNFIQSSKKLSITQINYGTAGTRGGDNTLNIKYDLENANIDVPTDGVVVPPVTIPSTNVVISNTEIGARSPDQYNTKGQWIASYPTARFTVNNIGNNPLYISKDPGQALNTVVSTGPISSVNALSITATGSTSGDTSKFFIVNSSRTFTVEYAVTNSDLNQSSNKFSINQIKYETSPSFTGNNIIDSGLQNFYKNLPGGGLLPPVVEPGNSSISILTPRPGESITYGKSFDIKYDINYNSNSLKLSLYNSSGVSVYQSPAFKSIATTDIEKNYVSLATGAFLSSSLPSGQYTVEICDESKSVCSKSGIFSIVNNTNTNPNTTSGSIIITAAPGSLTGDTSTSFIINDGTKRVFTVTNNTNDSVFITKSKITGVTMEAANPSTQAGDRIDSYIVNDGTARDFIVGNTSSNIISTPKTNLQFTTIPSVVPPTSANSTLSASCIGYQSTTVKNINWNAAVTGGSGNYKYEWSIYGDVASYGEGSTASKGVVVSYKSQGSKQAVIRASDGNSSVTASCATTIAFPTTTIAPQVSSQPTALVCPLGYICSSGTVAPICPSGYSCTTSTYNCPNGYTCTAYKANAVVTPVPTPYHTEPTATPYYTYPTSTPIPTPAQTYSTPTPVPTSVPTPTPAPTVTTDTSAPSMPSNLMGTALSTSQVGLSWSPSVDNVAVFGYRVYRNGTYIGSTTGTTYTDTGLVANSLYKYMVSSYDTTGNVSTSANTSVQTQETHSTTTSSPSSSPMSRNANGSSMASVFYSLGDFFDSITKAQ